MLKSINNSFLRPLISLFFLTFILVGCADFQKNSINQNIYGNIQYATTDVETRIKSIPPPPADMSHIYIIREKQFAGNAAPFYVYLDGSKVATMSVGSFIMLPVQSGEHTISSNMSWKGLTEMHHSKKTSSMLECYQGRKYFFLMRLDSGSVGLRQISKDEGENIVKESNMIIPYPY